MNRYSLFILVLVGVLAGCATPETRLRRHPETVAQLPAPELQDIKAGQIRPGYDMDAVRLALGRPDGVAIRPVDDKNSQEVWTYQMYKDEKGSPLFRGYYHRYFAHGDPSYPFYLDYPDRTDDGKIEVIFNGSNVVGIESEGLRQPVSTSSADMK